MKTTKEQMIRTIVNNIEKHAVNIAKQEFPNYKDEDYVVTFNQTENTIQVDVYDDEEVVECIGFDVDSITFVFGEE